MSSLSMASPMRLSKEDPRADSKIGLFVQCTLHYTYLDVIRSYWHRHKKIEVILAYLRTVHRMAVG